MKVGLIYEIETICSVNHVRSRDRVRAPRETTL